MRLRLFKQAPNFDYFSRWKLWLGISGLMMVLALVSFLLQGLNFGIDFRGGTTVRTDSPLPVVVGEYRDALAPLELGAYWFRPGDDPGSGMPRMIRWPRKSSDQTNNC